MASNVKELLFVPNPKINKKNILRVFKKQEKLQVMVEEGYHLCMSKCTVNAGDVIVKIIKVGYFIPKNYKGKKLPKCVHGIFHINDMVGAIDYFIRLYNSDDPSTITPTCVDWTDIVLNNMDKYPSVTEVTTKFMNKINEV